MIMTPHQLHALRKQLRISQTHMGRLVGRSRWSIVRWERGIIAIPDMAQIVLTKIAAEHNLTWVRGLWCRKLKAQPVVARVERNLDVKR